MDKKLRKSIDKLSEREAKTFLFQTVIRQKMILESTYSQEQMINELYAMNNSGLEFLQNKKGIGKKYDTVHIVCGESSAGSLRVGLGHENKVIGFPDFFAIGPIWDLHNDSGRENRYEWLRNNFNVDYMEEEYEGKFLDTHEEIKAIPGNIPIVIWSAENADEQTGIRYILHLLREKTNDVYLINTTIAYQELFNTSDVTYISIQTGEVSPEKLRLIYKQKLKKPLSVEERNQFQQEWSELSLTKEVLRIWKNGKIKGVNENFFDQLLISTVKGLHAKQSKKDFIKAARIIGEVLGRIENNVGDAFLEYRLRCLIYNGVFEIMGIPKGMRYYSVKLR